MTSFQRLTYAYLARLPVFFCFAPILLIIFIYFATELLFYPILYLIPFTIFFLTDRKKKLLTTAVLFIFGVMTFLSAFSFVDSIVAWVCLIILALVATRRSVFGYSRDAFITALALNALPVLFFIFSSNDLAQLVISMLLMNVAIIVIADILCRFYKGLDITTRNKSFLHQPKDAAERFLRRSHKLFFGFFGVGLAFVVVYAAWGFDIGSLELPVATQQRQEEWSGNFNAPALAEVYLISSDEGELDEHAAVEGDGRIPVVEYVFIVMTVFFTALLVLAIFLTMGKRRKRHRNINVAAHADEKTDEEAIAIGVRFSSKGTEALSTNRQVRRIFKRKVNAHRRQGLLVKQTDTPKRINDKINISEDIADLTTLYYHARYSNQQIPKSTLVALKRKNNS